MKKARDLNSLELFTPSDYRVLSNILSGRDMSLRSLAFAANRSIDEFFVGRDFDGISLAGVDLRGANLSRADLRGCGLRLSIIDQTTIIEQAKIDDEDVAIIQEMRVGVQSTRGHSFDLERATKMASNGEQIPDEWAKFITTLNLAGEKRLRTLKHIRNLVHLRTLDLRGTRINDIEPLSEMKSLKILYLSGTRVSKIDIINGLKNLETLTLDSTRVTDISPLAGLRKLSKLFISNTHIQDFSAIDKLSNLEFLDISQTSASNDMIELYNRRIKRVVTGSIAKRLPATPEDT